jgi:hypothetical protein
MRGFAGSEGDGAYCASVKSAVETYEQLLAGVHFASLTAASMASTLLLPKNVFFS